MTQNLDLDLVEGKALTPADSDVTENWTPGAGEGTIRRGEVSNDLWPNDIALSRSYDAGEFVYTKPTVSKNCITGSDGLSGETCVADGWVDVSGMIASSVPSYGNDVVDDTYNAHYLVGNYYSWNAATAGSGNDVVVDNTSAKDSICPKGWQLAMAGVKDDHMPLNSSKTLAYLLESYGWTWNQKNDLTWYTNSTTGGTDYDLRVAPFYFLYGGWVNGSGIHYAGANGNYWSAARYDAENAYYTYIQNSRVDAVIFVKKYGGYSVRCVAR